MSAVEYIKKTRGPLLKVYECPYETGWHLTKDSAEYDTENRTRRMLQNNDIPLSSRYDGKVKWEYVEEKTAEDPGASIKKPVLSKVPPDKPVKPIVRIDAKKGCRNISLEGRVVEIVKNISIENIFKIDLDNLFSASLAKDFLDDEYRQITVHAVRRGANRIDSYTALVKKALMQKHKIKKDDEVNIVVSGKCINNKTVWYCDSVYPL